MNNDAKIKDAQRARELKEGIEPFFETVRQELFNELSSTDDADVAQRERLFLELRAIDRVKTRLIGVINSGKIAEHALKLVATGKTLG